MSDQSEVIDVKAAAELLSCSTKQIYELAKRGALPGCRKLGGMYRIHRDTLLKWLAAGQGDAPPQR